MGRLHEQIKMNKIQTSPSSNRVRCIQSFSSYPDPLLSFSLSVFFFSICIPSWGIEQLPYGINFLAVLKKHCKDVTLIVQSQPTIDISFISASSSSCSSSSSSSSCSGSSTLQPGGDDLSTSYPSVSYSNSSLSLSKKSTGRRDDITDDLWGMSFCTCGCNPKKTPF